MFGGIWELNLNFVSGSDIRIRELMGRVLLLGPCNPKSFLAHVYLDNNEHCFEQIIG